MVLERDGTTIDEDELLVYFGTDVLMLLEEGEIWEPQNKVTPEEETVIIQASEIWDREEESANPTDQAPANDMSKAPTDDMSKAPTIDMSKF